MLSCEHASWMLPPGEDLGVDTLTLRSQAGWDHGAYEIAARIGETLGCYLHAGAFSRMYVDLNRPPDHPDVIPTVSYGASVPGNVGIDVAERARRLGLFHAPYWDSVRRDARARIADRGRCWHLSIHSFAPELEPEHRIYDGGVLYDPAAPFEAAIAERMLFGLRGHGLDVRANAPYHGTAPALVTSLRGELGVDAYAGIELEVSHRVTTTEGGCERVAAAMVAVIEEIVGG